jgi:O-Antigen ligase
MIPDLSSSTDSDACVEMGLTKGIYGYYREVKKTSIANFVRIPSALLLIALEFTSFVPFQAEGGTISRTIVHSRYPVYFAAYGICALIITLDLKSAKRFLEMPLVRWALAALMLFTWGMLVRTFNAPAGIEDYDFVRRFGVRMNSIGFLLCCTMIFDDPGALQITKQAVVVATLAGVALNIYDLMFPGFFSYYPGRAAGLYANPNISGISLVFGCVIGLTAIRRLWWQEAFVVVSFIGVLVTFSREAILAFGFVVLGGSLAGRFSLRRLAVAGGVGAALFVVLNIGNILLSEETVKPENWSRVTSQFFSDNSARDRTQLANKTLDAFEEAPLLGQGFGTTGYWSDFESHDLFLSLLADHGIIGMFLIPALLLSIGRKSWDFYAFAAAFLVVSLFSHEILDLAPSLISLAIEAVEANTRQVACNPEPRRWINGLT